MRTRPPFSLAVERFSFLTLRWRAFGAAGELNELVAPAVFVAAARGLGEANDFVPIEVAI